MKDIMKLAEALSIRAELQKKTEQLEQRLKSVVKIQEGDTPEESLETTSPTSSSPLSRVRMSTACCAFAASAVKRTAAAERMNFFMVCYSPVNSIIWPLAMNSYSITKG